MTRKELATALGVSTGTLSNWQRRGMPFTKTKAGISFEECEVKAWCANRGIDGKRKGRPRIDAQNVDSYVEETDGSLKLQLQRAELERRKALSEIYQLRAAKARGDLIDRRECEDGLVRRCVYLKATMNALPARLAPMLYGREIREIEEQLMSAMRDLQSQYAGSNEIGN